MGSRRSCYCRHTSAFGFVSSKRTSCRCSRPSLTSALFLACYLVYHALTKPKSIGLPAGGWRTAYLIMLFTHVVLAIGMLPMIAMTLWRAWHKQWKRHMAIARPTFFIWFYVSVTGVLVYLFLYHLAPAMYPNMAG